MPRSGEIDATPHLTHASQGLSSWGRAVSAVSYIQDHVGDGLALDTVLRAVRDAYNPIQATPADYDVPDLEQYDPGDPGVGL